MRKASGSLIAILLLSFLLAGCKPATTRDVVTEYEPVSIKMELTDLTGSERSVLPGSKAHLNVIVKGDDGKSYSLDDGSLRIEHLVLESTAITILKESKEVLFDSSIAEGDEYSIVAKFVGYEDKIKTS